MNTNVAINQAQIYDQLFVPALFGAWGTVLCDEAQITTGQSILDVACGTGALTCTASERAGEQGSVVGLDINDEMLAVARTKAEPVTWQQGSAESLPFDNASFDAVVSQFGYMFFENQVQSLAEMWRVLKPGGRMAVAVCDAIDHSPGYSVLTELLHRLFGHSVAEAFRAPFSSGDPDRLEHQARDAGLKNISIAQHQGEVRFASIEALVSTERACAWTLGGLLSNSQFDSLLEQAEQTLKPFVKTGGHLRFDMPALILCAHKQ